MHCVELLKEKRKTEFLNGTMICELIRMDNERFFLFLNENNAALNVD